MNNYKEDKVWVGALARTNTALKLYFRAAVSVSRGKHDWCKFGRGLNDASFYFAPRDLSRSVIIVKTSFEARPTDEACLSVERLRDFLF